MSTLESATITTSVEVAIKVGEVRFTAALFVPWARALVNQLHFGIAFGFGDRPMDRYGFLTQEPVVIDFHRVELAMMAEEIRFDIFVARNAARD